MIPLSLTQTFLFPLIASLALLFLLWMLYSFQAYRLARKNRRNTYLYRCENCLHAYIDHREVPLTRCPRCGSLNEKIGA